MSKRSKWVLLRNVFKAIVLLKTPEVEGKNLSDLLEEIKAIPTDEVYRLSRSRTRDRSPYVRAIKELRRQQIFESSVQRGGPEDIQQILIEIENDPYKLLRNPGHPFALINKRNSKGQTPLYIACKNGNFQLVELFLKLEADHVLTSTVDGEEETCLEVAIRWRHIEIVKLLLTKSWTEKVIKKAERISRLPQIKALFRPFKSKNKLIFCCMSKN
jgi:hypothetical protein